VTIFSLNNTILLWYKRTRTLRHDSFALKKIMKLIRHVFAARIRVQNLDAGRELSLKKCKEALKD
jgi:hypothetical protein